MSAPEPSSIPPGVPAEALPFLRAAGYFDNERLEVGSLPPTITLQPLGGGEPVTIGAAAEQPVVLIFGSYT